jgi:hypothetical protein
MAVAVGFQVYIKSSWRLQRFLGRDFVQLKVLRGLEENSGITQREV